MLVSSPGSKIESVEEVVAESSSSKRVEPLESGLSHQEKGKTAAHSVSFTREVDGKEGENEGYDENDELGTDNGNDYVSDSRYGDIIAMGFDKRFPFRLASSQHA